GKTACRLKEDLPRDPNILVSSDGLKLSTLVIVKKKASSLAAGFSGGLFSKSSLI
ncbi:hypothetical protein M9458_028203, partial [Cirrhinus mrigala]